MNKSLQFSNNWFGVMAEGIWKQLLPQIKPRRILEVGSYEGRSAVAVILLNNWAESIELYCLDTWAGGIEHINRSVDMSNVEKLFDKNISIAQKNAACDVVVHKLKNPSHVSLSKLISDGFENYFDFIYIDGSHVAPDVLIDAVLAFQTDSRGRRYGV